MHSTRYVDIKKSDDKKRIVFAEVYAPDRPDSDNEFMRADEIEKMAYGFMKTMKLDAIDHQHSQNEADAVGCVVVESFIARKGDPDFIEGAWVVGMYIGNDELWAKVEKGEINGFSMEATVFKDKQDVEMDVPDSLTGKTLKEDASDHAHDFVVNYATTGEGALQFVGGRTSVHTDGHFHVIKSGTVTEVAGSNQHRHRFSHVESVKIR